MSSRQLEGGARNKVRLSNRPFPRLERMYRNQSLGENVPELVCENRGKNRGNVFRQQVRILGMQHSGCAKRPAMSH
jgi:hypothetical protein